MRNLNRMVEMLQELNEVVKEKGLDLHINELERHLDFTDHERENERAVMYMVNKLEIEKALNNYNGLANAIRMAVQYEQQQEVD